MYEENGEWILLDAKLKTGVIDLAGYKIETAVATLTLQRRTTFYILNNILPVVFLSFLNTFVFLLPEESGEKMSLCVSILLSYAVFLTLINSYLPENSDHLCFFSVYVTLLVLISTLTCLVTIFILALHSHLQKVKIAPRWLTTFAGFKSNAGTSCEIPCQVGMIRDRIIWRCRHCMAGELLCGVRCGFILLLCRLTLGSVSYKEKDFLDNLTLNYDPKIRPVLDGSNTMVANKNLNLETYNQNGEFNLVSASMALRKFRIHNTGQEWIEVTMVLQRRTMFYILNNILPVVFLSFLNTFVFLLPEESGEMMSLCVSILLSYAMFLTLINSYLPANSDHLCFFSVYVTLLVLISTLTCLATIFMLILHTHLQRGMASPRWLPIALGSDGKVGTTEPRIKNDDVAPYQSDVKDKANKKLDMKDAIITKCNRVAFGTFFTLTILVNLIFFICVSL
ncbi:uncharacterized protein [Haliotis cracherodii]|uniref:uncharacterized protein n=1 Tax=Haliotis cracherodii TaxID=6455 RepID=UPI0039EB3AFB